MASQGLHFKSITPYFLALLHPLSLPLSSPNFFPLPSQLCLDFLPPQSLPSLYLLFSNSYSPLSQLSPYSLLHSSQHSPSSLPTFSPLILFCSSHFCPPLNFVTPPSSNFPHSIPSLPNYSSILPFPSNSLPPSFLLSPFLSPSFLQTLSLSLLLSKLTSYFLHPHSLSLSYYSLPSLSPFLFTFSTFLPTSFPLFPSQLSSFPFLLPHLYHTLSLSPFFLPTHSKLLPFPFFPPHLF